MLRSTSQKETDSLIFFKERHFSGFGGQSEIRKYFALNSHLCKIFPCERITPLQGHYSSFVHQSLEYSSYHCFNTHKPRLPKLVRM